MADDLPKETRGGIRAPVRYAARRALFLARLAETSNVTGAAAAAGLDTSSLYKLKRRDPAFAERWREALEEGYGRIESELMQRALGDSAEAGAPADVEPAAGGDVVAGQGTALAPIAEPPRAPFDTDLGLKLLSLHRRAEPTGRRRGPPLKQPDTADALAALERKLTAMERRVAARTVAAPGTDGKVKR